LFCWKESQSIENSEGSFEMLFSTSFLLGLNTAVATVDGALVRVTNFGSNPTNLEMNIAVPAKLASKPAIILAVSRRASLTSID
jgi:hypothetical protein